MRLRVKHFLIGIFVFLGLLIGIVISFPDGKIHLVFCDVGQGDAIYIKTPKGSDILIDGGPNEKVLQCLGRHMPFYDRTIEMMVLTHPQADHLTGLILVLERYRVKKILLENIYVDNKLWRRFQKAVIFEGAELYNPKAGDKIIIDGVELVAFWPREVVGDRGIWNKQISRYTNMQINKQISNYQIGERCDETCQRVLGASTVSGDLNDYSLVFLLKYNDFEALLTADAEEPVLSKIFKLKEGNREFNLIENGLDILKVPHHGSKISLSTTLIDQLKPKIAVISVGKNSFGHPAEEILKILSEKKIKTLRTDKDKEIEIKI